MIAPSVVLGRPPSVTLEGCDAVVKRYRAFFGVVDWSLVSERAAGRPWPGRAPHPRSAYIKALLVKLCQQTAYITDPRRFLVEHPALVLELGLRPVVAAAQPLGFDVEQTVPCDRWLRHQQQHLEHAALPVVLAGTVPALQAEIPGLGTTVAVDVKHIYAWLQENNPEAYITNRHDPERHPHGDPDYRLGVKRRTNQEHADGRTTVHKELVGGGDGTGGIAAIPLNLRGQAPPNRDDQGRPRCAKGLTMVPRYQFTHEDGYRVQRYGCPLLVPTPTDQSCDDPPFRSGSGCVIGINLEPGGLMRATLDRQADAYKAIYRQRTSAERINSQATALGIEPPRVRNAQSVHRLNTLTYVVINARALQHARSLNAALPRSLTLC